LAQAILAQQLRVEAAVDGRRFSLKFAGAGGNNVLRKTGGQIL